MVPIRNSLRRRGFPAFASRGMKVIERRLAKARGEIENYRQYRYILVNDILDQAVESLTAIVIAERARREGTPQDPETERMIKLAEKCRQANATDMHATPA